MGVGVRVGVGVAVGVEVTVGLEVTVGVGVTVGYNVDSFGHSAALPRLPRRQRVAARWWPAALHQGWRRARPKSGPPSL